MNAEFGNVQDAGERHCAEETAPPRNSVPVLFSKSLLCLVIVFKQCRGLHLPTWTVSVLELARSSAMLPSEASGLRERVSWEVRFAVKTVTKDHSRQYRQNRQQTVQGHQPRRRRMAVERDPR